MKCCIKAKRERGSPESIGCCRTTSAATSSPCACPPPPGTYQGGPWGFQAAERSSQEHRRSVLSIVKPQIVLLHCVCAAPWCAPGRHVITALQSAGLKEPEGKTRHPRLQAGDDDVPGSHGAASTRQGSGPSLARPPEHSQLVLARPDVKIPIKHVFPESVCECASSLSSTQGVRRADHGPSFHLLGGIYP